MKSFSKGVRGKRREKKATEKSRREGESGGPLRFPLFSTCFFFPFFFHSSPPFRPLSLSPLPPSLCLSRTSRNKTKKHQGGFQYWLYNIKFTKLCAPLTARFGHAAVAPIKVFLDQGIHHPLIYFPFFYGLKAFVEGKPMRSAADKYKREIKDSCKALWKIWVPAQLVNFAFVPRHLRIPYVAAVSFGWTVVLSTMQGRYAKQEEEAAAAAGAPGSGGPGPALAVEAAAAAAEADRFGRASQELMAGIVATGGVPSPSSPPSSAAAAGASGAASPKEGGGGAAVSAPAAAAPPRPSLGGLKELAAGGAGGEKGGRSSSSPAIVAASRAEAAALVAGCATGAGGGAAAA